MKVTLIIQGNPDATYDSLEAFVRGLAASGMFGPTEGWVDFEVGDPYVEPPADALLCGHAKDWTVCTRDALHRGKHAASDGGTIVAVWR